MPPNCQIMSTVAPAAPPAWKLIFHRVVTAVITLPVTSAAASATARLSGPSASTTRVSATAVQTRETRSGRRRCSRTTSWKSDTEWARIRLTRSRVGTPVQSPAVRRAHATPAAGDVAPVRLSATMT